MKRIKDIVVVAQTPPPFYGQAIMLKAFLDGSYTRIRLHHVRLAFSSSLEEVGKPGWKKIVHLLEVIFQIYKLRLVKNAPVFFYPPAGPNLIPVLRDVVILLATRWLFSECVFNFRAAGLGEYLKSLPSPLRQIAYIAYGKPDIGIVLTSLTRPDAKALQAKKTIVVPSGVEDRRPKGDPNRRDNDPLTILFMGMVCEEKGVSVLLEACSQLSEQDVDYRCVIAGDSRSPEELARFQIKAAEISTKITFPGLVTGADKWQLYREADIFCFPTFYSSEALPSVLLEAMMFGLPIVSTDWRGIPDVIIEGKTGFLVPPQNATEIQKKLARLIKDGVLRRTMGSAALEVYESHYTLEAFQLRMEDALTYNDVTRH